MHASYHQEGVKLLLDNFADKININAQDVKGNTAFLRLCNLQVTAAQLPALQLLVEKYKDKININATNLNRENALSRIKSPEALEYLLKQFSTLDITQKFITNFRCETFFSKNCIEGNEPLITHLLKNYQHIIDINDTNLEKDTALISLAEMPARTSILKLLLDYGKNLKINHQNQYGNTALMVACEEKNINAVNILLNSGLDINLKVRNKQGRTAMMIAKKKGYLEIFNTLREYQQSKIISNGLKNRTICKKWF